MGKLRIIPIFAVLLTLAGAFVFSFTSEGGVMSSGYGVFYGMIYFWNVPNYYPFLFLLGILLAIFLQLIGVPLRLFGLVGSLFLGSIFIPLILSYIGIDIPTWTAIVQNAIGQSTSGVMWGTVPIHYAVLSPELGLGSFLVAGGSVFGIIGSLIPHHKKKKDEDDEF